MRDRSEYHRLWWRRRIERHRAWLGEMGLPERKPGIIVRALDRSEQDAAHRALRRSVTIVHKAKNEGNAL